MSTPTTPLKKSEKEKLRKKLFANCRSVIDFEKISTLGEGTYGTVYSARDNKSGEIVAIKKLKIHEMEQGFPVTSLREINILKQLRRISPHPNIVNLKEVVVGARSESIFLVFEYCEMDLGHLVDMLCMDKIFFSECEIKCITLQILNSILHLHQNYIMHRDLKLSNILVNSQGIMKLADFGLSKTYEEDNTKYTGGVVTLYYRAPEIVIGHPYDQKSDMWSIGCIFGELLNFGKPILPGKNEEHQFELICSLIGILDLLQAFQLKKAGRLSFPIKQKISTDTKGTSFTKTTVLKTCFLDYLTWALTSCRIC